MMKFQLIAASLGAVSLASAAGAAAVYNNIDPNTAGGDCSFSTTCASQVGRGDDFAAQVFTLGSADTLTGASFETLDNPANSTTSANWAFYSAVGGLPVGPALFSGSSATTDTTVGSVFGYYALDINSFSLGSVSLVAGDYAFAVQAVTPEFQTYLSQGLVDSGAAETFDGGLTFTPSYEGMGGIGVALTDGAAAVPEPATWAMMLAGFGLVGVAARRRSAKAIAG